MNLDPANQKSKEDNKLSVHSDRAAELRGWLATELRSVRQAHGEIGPGDARMKLPADMSVFSVPTQLVKMLRRDLKAAGIPKRDDQVRKVNVHELWHSIATLLIRGEVAP